MADMSDEREQALRALRDADLITETGDSYIIWLTRAIAALFDADPPLAVWPSVLEARDAELAAAREERDGLAKIVGELWDYPPDGPSGHVDVFHERLRDRWGGMVAGLWTRLTDHRLDRPWDEYDGWMLGAEIPEVD